jgi:hypothetical protein
MFNFDFLYKVLSEIPLILRIIQRDIIINVHWPPHKVPVIFDRFQYKSKFIDSLSKHPQIRNFTKIRPVGAELFRADGQCQTYRGT